MYFRLTAPFELLGIKTLLLDHGACGAESASVHELLPTISSLTISGACLYPIPPINNYWRPLAMRNHHYPSPRHLHWSQRSVRVSRGINHNSTNGDNTHQAFAFNYGTLIHQPRSFACLNAKILAIHHRSHAHQHPIRCLQLSHQESNNSCR